MHKALSYGSALQAYALQKKICELGYEAILIDYKYPNKAHIQGRNTLRYYIETLISFGVNMIWGFPNLIKKSRFRCFYNNHYNLSVFYPTEKSIKDNPPRCDVYMTGSDQVWNPNFILQDRTFMLSFAKDDAKRVSYGSSFAVSQVPKAYKPSYCDCLSKYSMITVREASGIDLVKELTGKEATQVCDPTLLLGKTEWDTIANESKIQINEPYILVFLLGYSFNPYPQVKNLIKKVKDSLGLKVIYLDGRKDDLFQSNSKILKNTGPADFLYLVRNASYVITDSFHGTVFSTIYSRPLTAVVKSGNTDSRIVSFLRKIGREECAVSYDSTTLEISTKTDYSQSAEFVESSLKILKEMLS